jgi:hypothetical protein
VRLDQPDVADGRAPSTGQAQRRDEDVPCLVGGRPGRTEADAGSRSPSPAASRGPPPETTDQTRPPAPLPRRDTCAPELP